MRVWWWCLSTAAAEDVLAHGGSFQEEASELPAAAAGMEPSSGGMFVLHCFPRLQRRKAFIIRQVLTSSATQIILPTWIDDQISEACLHPTTWEYHGLPPQVQLCSSRRTRFQSHLRPDEESVLPGRERETIYFLLQSCQMMTRSSTNMKALWRKTWQEFVVQLRSEGHASTTLAWHHSKAVASSDYGPRAK
jgi:hypothetical protein